jgi:hypothetical protein
MQVRQSKTAIHSAFVKVESASIAKGKLDTVNRDKLDLFLKNYGWGSTEISTSCIDARTWWGGIYKRH